MKRSIRSICTLAVVAAVTAALGSTGAAERGRAGVAVDHRGGTLELLAAAAAGTIDPHVNYTYQYWQLYQAAYDGLLAFRKAGGAAGVQVVPDLAVKMPKPTNGGKRWVFKLRKGIRFSTAASVTPADVVSLVQAHLQGEEPDVRRVSQRRHRRRERMHRTSGGLHLERRMIADDDAGTVTINLVAPDPEFDSGSSFPNASILPSASRRRATPARSRSPGTGAYYFASYRPNRSS